MPATSVSERVASIALALLLLTGCSRAGRVAQANDELRDENLKLKQQAAELTSRNKELDIELHRQSAQPTTLPEDIRTTIPHVTGIEIGRMSFARDADGDGIEETLTIYVNPTDGRGRFTQMVGTVSINAAYVPANADASSIGRASFAPTQVRDAYRSSLMGTHYVFDVPFKKQVVFTGPGDHESAVVIAEYVDGLTGEKFTAERSVSLK